jgi:hypothetical protein
MAAYNSIGNYCRGMASYSMNDPYNLTSYRRRNIRENFVPFNTGEGGNPIIQSNNNEQLAVQAQIVNQIQAQNVAQSGAVAAAAQQVRQAALVVQHAADDLGNVKNQLSDVNDKLAGFAGD